MKTLTIILILGVSQAVQAWTTIHRPNHIDESFTAWAETARTTRPQHMEFAYAGMEDVSMGYVCNGKTKTAYDGSVYISFNRMHSATGNFGKNAQTYEYMVKFDDTPASEMAFNQYDDDMDVLYVDKNSGDRFEFLSGIMKHDNMWIKSHGHGEGETVFKFSLNGAKKAIQDADKKCGVVFDVANKAHLSEKLQSQ